MHAQRVCRASLLCSRYGAGKSGKALAALGMVGMSREMMELPQRQSFELARPSPRHFADGVLVAARHGRCGGSTSPSARHFDLSPDSWHLNAGFDIITRPSALL